MGGRIMTDFIVLRPKMYSYLADDDCVDKKTKKHREVRVKARIQIRKKNSGEDDPSKDLGVRHTMYFQKRSTRFH